MNKKGIVAAVLVLAVLAGLGYYFGGDSLQGRFDKIGSGTKTGPSASSTTGFGGKKTSSSSSTSSSTEILLTVTPDETYNTVTLSEVDWTDEDSQWYAVGKYNYQFASDVSFCSTLHLSLNDGTSSYQYQDWFEEAFADTQLQFRDADGNFVKYVSVGSDEAEFELGTQGLPTEGFFYVEVRPSQSVASNYKNKKMYIYLQRVCAEKDGSKYIWFNDDSNGQNSYFSITADAVPGLKGGWAKILD